MSKGIFRSYPVRIIYASRTHSQLKQVVRELQKTCYRPRVAYLASREKLCINSEISSYHKKDLNNYCRQLVNTNSCKYVEFEEEVIKVGEKLLYNRQALDIEELRDLGKTNSTCPYYTSRHLATQADLIMIPYNYLTDQAIRPLFADLFQNAIIIFDEAHNIERAAEDGASVALSLSDFPKIQKELSEFHKGLEKAHSNSLNLKFNVSCLLRMIQILIDCLRQIKSSFKTYRDDLLDTRETQPWLDQAIDEVKDFKESADILFCEHIEKIEPLAEPNNDFIENHNPNGNYLKLSKSNFMTFYKILQNVHDEIRRGGYRFIFSEGSNLQILIRFLKVFITQYEKRCTNPIEVTEEKPINDYVLNFSMQMDRGKGRVHRNQNQTYR